MVEGVQLNGVREGSPAEKAGLKAGDIIIKFGDRVIKNVYDYTYALQDHKPGDMVQVIVKRGDQTLKLNVTLAAPPGIKVLHHAHQHAPCIAADDCRPR